MNRKKSHFLKDILEKSLFNDSYIFILIAKEGREAA